MFISSSQESTIGPSNFFALATELQTAYMSSSSRPPPATFYEYEQNHLQIINNPRRFRFSLSHRRQSKNGTEELENPRNFVHKSKHISWRSLQSNTKLSNKQKKEERRWRQREREKPYDFRKYTDSINTFIDTLTKWNARNKLFNENLIQVQRLEKFSSRRKLKQKLPTHIRYNYAPPKKIARRKRKKIFFSIFFSEMSRWKRKSQFFFHWNRDMELVKRKHELRKCET